MRNLIKLIESWSRLRETDDEHSLAHDYGSIGKHLRDIEQDKQSRYGPYHGGNPRNQDLNPNKPPFHNDLIKLGFEYSHEFVNDDEKETQPEIFGCIYHHNKNDSKDIQTVLALMTKHGFVKNQKNSTTSNYYVGYEFGHPRYDYEVSVEAELPTAGGHSIWVSTHIPW